MDKINRSEKAVKDLSFLLSLPKSNILPNLVKYMESPGTGSDLGDISVPAHFYITFIKFDYEGRFISQVKNISIKNPTNKYDINIPLGVYEAIKGMKLYERSWFNMKSEELHDTKDLKHKGCHFYITVEDVKYKNAETMQSKELVYDMNKKQGKEFFQAKDYESAIKKYKNIVNITSGIDKKKYSEEEQKKLQEYNLNAKQNYIRCFIKLNKPDEMQEEFAEQYSTDLLKKENNLRLFLRAKTLLKRKYVTDSLVYAQKLYEADPSEDSKNLLNEIKEKLTNKK